MTSVAGGRPVDQSWAARSLGIDYGAPTHAVGAAAGAAADDGAALQREVIEFDSEAPEGAEFRAVATKAPGGLSQFVDIPWPDGLAPQPGHRPRGESLPRADVLIV